MSKTLRASHAVDVGGMVVEPGDPIPDDADPSIVQRLEDEGLLEASSSKRASKSSDASSSGE